MRWGGAQSASVLLLMVLALPIAACGEDTTGDGSAQPQGTELQLTLGTKDFTEPFLLGELYEQALAARGYKVTLRKDIGSTEVIDTELTSGQIDAYPEYLGVAVTVVAGEADAGSSAAETYRLANDFYAQRGQALSEQTPFENVDAIATTQFFAQQQRLASLAGPAPAAQFHAGRAAGVRGSRPGPRRPAATSTGSPTPSSSRSRSALSTRRLTRATSTPRTSSPPTASSRAGTTGCSRIPSGCSASSTWRW